MPSPQPTSVTEFQSPDGYDCSSNNTHSPASSSSLTLLPASSKKTTDLRPLKRYSPADLLDSPHGNVLPHIRFSTLSAPNHQPFHNQKYVNMNDRPLDDPLTPLFL
jgi:hypothetical protein